MAFKGNVESFSLADVFQNLAMNNQTGTLRITPDKQPAAVEETYVYFQDGYVRFLSHSSRAPLLPPEVFIARGLVSKSEFDAALLRQAESQETIVAALVGMGCVHEQQIQDLLLHQIGEEIYDLFGWETAAFEFNEGPPPEGLFAAEAAEAGWGVSIQVSHLIMEAARRVDEWERLRKVIPSPREIFVVDLTVRKAIERGEMETDAVERRVAMLVDGARDVDDVVADSQLFKFEVYGALAGYLQSSVIRPATLNELNFSEAECARQDLPRRRVKILERILALGGENLRIRQELAGLMAKLGQVEHACIHYSILAAADLKAGNEEGAIDIYKCILALVPQNVKTRQALAELYAKRGQKRDAFTQFQELFENLRDQHQLREARAAAAAALENDPTNHKLRNALVELLLMDDCHEEASHQLELLGDSAARSRNTPLAADAYRRAMQYRKSIRPLKKKLNEVLLTKEDRAARRRRAVLSVVMVLAIAGGLGALLFHENRNAELYNTALAEIEPDLSSAKLLEEDKKYDDAKQHLERAILRLAQFKDFWSPLKRIKDSAENKAGDLTRVIDRLRKNKQTDERLSASNREEKRNHAETLVRRADYAAAQREYAELLKDPNASDLEKSKDEKALKNIESYQADFKTALERIQRIGKDTGDKPFRDAAEEFRFVNSFLEKYRAHKNLPMTLKYPLLITLVDVDDVNVTMDDDSSLGTFHKNAPPEERILRYLAGPSASSHTLTFSKRGYTTQVENTNTHQSPELVEIKVTLKRKPDIKEQYPNAHFDGVPSFSDGLILAGTSEGGLLEIDPSISPPRLARRYEFEQASSSVEKQIIGQIFVWRGSGQPVFLYCTRAGYLVAVRHSGLDKFESLWDHPPQRVLPPNTTLAFDPCYFVHSGKPMVALVYEKHVLLLDGSTGAPLPNSPALELSVAATSGASFLNRDGGMLLLGGKDSNLHAVMLDGKTKPVVWGTELSAVGSFIQVPPAIVDDKIVAAGNQGALVKFSTTGTHMKPNELAVGGVSVLPLVDGTKLYFACSGGPNSEGLTLLDVGGDRRNLPRSINNASIAQTPAKISKFKRVYLITTDHRLLVLDSEDLNKEYWRFAFDQTVNCPPLADDRRVYLLCADGTIFGFDEPL